MLYLNPEAVFEFARSIASEIHPIPLILKTGAFPSKEIMQECLIAAAKAGAKCICGINSVSMRVYEPEALRLSEFCGLQAAYAAQPSAQQLFTSSRTLRRSSGSKSSTSRWPVAAASCRRISSIRF